MKIYKTKQKKQKKKKQNKKKTKEKEITKDLVLIPQEWVFHSFWRRSKNKSMKKWPFHFNVRQYEISMHNRDDS